MVISLKTLIIVNSVHTCLSFRNSVNIHTNKKASHFCEAFALSPGLEPAPNAFGV
jgi:hypothetical protein